MAALVGAAVTVATLTAPTHWAPFLSTVETWLSDMRTAMLAEPMPQDDRLVIFAIGESALAGLPYVSPIDRGLLADSLSAIASKGPTVIGLDILFTRSTEPEKDARLKAAIDGATVPIVVAWAEAGWGLDKAEAAYLATFAAKAGKGWPNLLKNERDATVRWFASEFGPDNAVSRRTFPAAIAEAAGAKIGSGQQRLDYRRPPGPDKPPFRVFPIEAAKLMPPAWLAGKIVLIGADLAGTDRHRVPGYARGAVGASAVPGVYIHAHAISQLLDGRTVPEAGLGSRLLLALAAVAAGLALATLVRLWPLQVVAGLFAAFALVGVGFWAAAENGPALPMLTPVLGMLVAVAGGITLVGRRLKREKRFIRSAFAHYLAPAVVAELERTPEALRLGGERRELTALFTDVAGFTNLSEGMDPQALGSLLNRYFDGMCEAVVKTEGTIDKFVGDALVALFGAPALRPDHAERALACALAIDRFCEDFRAAERVRGVDFGVTRIGLHSGLATVGNFGGEARFNYTALGDTVNTAARLEGANKLFGTRLCVSGTTAAACPGHRFRPIGDIVVKGKEAPVTVFEPEGAGGVAGGPAWTGYLEAYERLRGDGQGALAAFEALARQFPDDGPTAFHLKRLRSGANGTLIKLTEK